MKKYFKARGSKENYDPQNKHKDIFYFAEDTGQLLLDGVSYSEATDLTPYAKAANLPDSVISNADISSDANNVTLKYTKDDLIDRGNSEVNLQIPAATSSAAGAMSASDKKKMNNIPGLLATAIAAMQEDPSYIRINLFRNNLSTGDVSTYPAYILPATSSAAGIMSGTDKTKLDSLVKYKAGNGIDITGDTISCTLDTSLYSIVTELPETGLPNKIYLLPSTKTEEGNIYTEYGYVDNKWEELGKYKADVDLSPYSKALYLPKYIVGQDVDGGDIISSHYYPDKVQVEFVRVNLIDNSNLNDWFDINSVTTAYAGVMSCIDKRKLDGIEKEAQVNKIESISVNGTPLEITNKGVNIPIHEYTAGDGINIADGVISTTPISIKTENFSFVNSGSHQPTYNYSGVTIYDDRYISGTKYGIAFDKADIEPRTTITSPDGVRTVCFALNKSVRGKIDSIDYKENRLNFKSTSYLTYSRSGSDTNIDIKDDIKTSIDSIPGKQDALTEVQLNNINNAITSISVNDVEQVNTNGTVNLTIPNATTSKEGLMSKEDKAKLDSQPTIKASGATGVTDDDYVVIKKSEYQSILDRLSALEGS